MSSILPAGEHESEANIPSTPNIKLADFLKEEPVTDGSPLGLDSNPPKEGYVPVTHKLSATNRDMHTTSAAEDSPTGALEGATAIQPTKRAMAMRKIQNANEANINLLVEKLDELLLQYKGRTTMREWLDKLRPLLQNSNTTTMILPSSYPCRDISPNWRRNSDLKTPNLPLRRCRLTS